MPINGKQTYYEFFGLENFDNNAHRIKKAYHKMALKWHPDRNEDKVIAERMMKQVNEIWVTLSGDKDSYDRYLRRKLNPEREERSHGSADAWDLGGAQSWTFDTTAMDAMIHRMHEEQMREAMRGSNNKRSKIRKIVNELDHLSERQLERIEDMIQLLRRS